ncbi:sensor histidine kinase [Salinispira pacifica]|nr:sensor histidine kinase [Salinispira pacifica]
MTTTFTGEVMMLLGSSAAIFSALALGYAVIQRYIPGESALLTRNLKTLLFLLVSTLSFFSAQEIAQGIYAESGEALVLLAVYFAGPLGALLSALIFTFLRLYLGSVGFSFSLFLPLLIFLVYQAIRFTQARLRAGAGEAMAGIQKRFRKLFRMTSQASPLAVLLSSSMASSMASPLASLLALGVAATASTLIRYRMLAAAQGLEASGDFNIHALVLFPLVLLFGGFMSMSDSSRMLLEKRRRRELEFQHLFEYAPIPLWEEDYSRAYSYVKEFGTPLEDRQVENIISNISEYFSHIRIVNMNQRAVSLAAAESKEELLARLDETFLPETARSFIPEILALSEQRMSCSTHSEIRNLEGKRQYVKIQWNVLPEFARDYRRVIVSFIDNTELIVQGQRIEESMGRRGVLIKEIHHRVRNSLSIAYSILAMKQENFSTELERLAITRAQNRIQTIALLHTRLYMDNEVLIIRVRSYFEELTRMICAPFSEEVELRVPDIQLSIEQLLPLGLLMGELLFTRLSQIPEDERGRTRRGILTIRSYFHEIHCQLSDTFQLPRSDGRSMEDPRLTPVELMITESLTLQLRGRLSERTEHGVHNYDLYFPLREGI